MILSLHAGTFLTTVASMIRDDLGMNLIEDSGSGESFFFQPELDPVSESVGSHFGAKIEANYETQTESHQTEWVGILWNREAFSKSTDDGLGKRPLPRVITSSADPNEFTVRKPARISYKINVKFVSNCSSIIETLLEWYETELRGGLGCIGFNVEIDGQTLPFETSLVFDDITLEDDPLRDFQNPIFTLTFGVNLSGLIYSPLSSQVKRVKSIILNLWMKEFQDANNKLVYTVSVDAP